MSYAHGTPFLNLAQTVGTDHRDWFDENEAKLDLDTKMKTLWDGAADTAAILASLQESVSSLDTDVTTLQGVVSGHTSTITTINESLVLINTALNALNTQVTNKFDSAGIADPYDAAHGIYAVGDVVTYNGQRYVCSTAVTAAEPFDVSKWTAEDVQTELDKIISDISNKYDVTFESYASGTAENKIQQIGDDRYFIAFAVNTTSIMATGDHIFGSIDSSLPTGLLVVFDSVTGRANQGYVDSNRKIHVKLVNPDGIAASTQLSVIGLLYE